MAKSTKALLTGRIQKCKANPSIAHIGACDTRPVHTIIALLTAAAHLRADVAAAQPHLNPALSCGSPNFNCRV
jgi:hypothetical protein